MFAATDTARAPWYFAPTDDKKRGRLNVITHVLTRVPYEPLKHRDVTLPERQGPGGYRARRVAARHPVGLLTSEQPRTLVITGLRVAVAGLRAARGRG
jgi:Polyphosphate kinase 2 (PPK2)